MAVFVLFLTNFNKLVLTLINGVFSHLQKYSDTGITSGNILVSPLFPKKSELIFGRGAIMEKYHKHSTLTFKCKGEEIKLS